MSIGSFSTPIEVIDGLGVRTHLLISVCNPPLPRRPNGLASLVLDAPAMSALGLFSKARNGPQGHQADPESQGWNAQSEIQEMLHLIRSFAIWHQTRGSKCSL
jgi:hypothetical protein